MERAGPPVLEELAELLSFASLRARRSADLLHTDRRGSAHGRAQPAQFLQALSSERPAAVRREDLVSWTEDAAKIPGAERRRDRAACPRALPQGEAAVCAPQPPEHDRCGARTRGAVQVPAPAV